MGAVTAMEVLAEFPGDGLAPLENFKVWSDRVEIGMPVGNKTREKLRKLPQPGVGLRLPAAQCGREQGVLHLGRAQVGGGQGLCQGKVRLGPGQD